MYYSRKKPMEELPMEDTAVWMCATEDCNSWMRDSFAFEAQPVCQRCQSPMISGIKSLPVLVNSTTTKKQPEA